MANTSSQNSVPEGRVNIVYEVDTNGAIKKVNLPHVMGVMADLSGKPENGLRDLDERRFLTIDANNFNERLKAQTPRVAFHVPNRLTGEGNLGVDITFESMDDFSPAAVARKVEPLNKLLQARTELSNLLSYVDGKSDAEEILAKIIKDETLLKTLISTPCPKNQPKDTNEE